MVTSEPRRGVDLSGNLLRESTVIKKFQKKKKKTASASELRQTEGGGEHGHQHRLLDEVGWAEGQGQADEPPSTLKLSLSICLLDSRSGGKADSPR